MVHSTAKIKVQGYDFTLTGTLHGVEVKPFDKSARANGYRSLMESYARDFENSHAYLPDPVASVAEHLAAKLGGEVVFAPDALPYDPSVDY